MCVYAHVSFTFLSSSSVYSSSLLSFTSLIAVSIESLSFFFFWLRRTVKFKRSIDFFLDFDKSFFLFNCDVFVQDDDDEEEDDEDEDDEDDDDEEDDDGYC